MKSEEISSVDKGVEFDPYYSEIEFILSQFYSQTDPLSQQEQAPAVNWELIREYSERLLIKCFDLRVVLWRIRANLHLEGLSAFYLGLASIDREYSAGMDNIFPQVDVDQPADSTHAVALDWLATTQCLNELKNSRVFSGNRLTVDELLNMRHSTQEGTTLHFSELVTIIGQADMFFSSTGLPSLRSQLSLALSALECIESHANLKSEGYRLECRLVKEYLNLLSSFLVSLDKQGMPFVEEAEHAAPRSIKPGAFAGGSAIRSRQDVVLLLDNILDYFQQYEPSHPAPILIKRSQKMIGMDFVTIVEELLPESQGTLLQLSGK